MYTWNFQYISKSHLEDIFKQLLLNESDHDILIRIHTAIHQPKEAVELSGFIKEMVPKAHIFGTSTSAVIAKGKLLRNQCVISVTQMQEGRIQMLRLPTFEETGEPVVPEVLCQKIREKIMEEDTKLLLSFLTRKYLDVASFVEQCNDYFPGVQMIGGLAGAPENNARILSEQGFVFDENGWSYEDLLAASISGKRLDSFTSYTTGTEAIGREVQVTDAFGSCILSIDGKDAAEQYQQEIGEEFKDRIEYSSVFPYVYAEVPDVPIIMRCSDDHCMNDLFPVQSPLYRRAYEQRPDIEKYQKKNMLNASHNVRIGRKQRRAFIHDRKVVADNRSMFRQVENFEKAETIFGYSCIIRAMIYSNCVKWELSAYENSNICGCLTEGEIVYANGRNLFANCAFAVSAIGEEKAKQQYNPYVFMHAEALEKDNEKLLQYLLEMESRFEQIADGGQMDDQMAFVRECEKKLLYSDNSDMPNAAAMSMDIRLKGYDRICMINVYDIASMRTVFTEQLIQLTYQNYLSRCESYAKEKHYRFYHLDRWRVAIGAPSYLVSLSDFAQDMEALQRILFETHDEYIAIVPMFCILDNCKNVDTLAVYSAARVEMLQKNVQFYVRNVAEEQLDEDSIRWKYHIVNVINYAISHDKVIPYFQGIYDNRERRIHHYESLMRLEDEEGNLYYPDSFLDVARSFGLLYDRISMLMIKKVFSRFKDQQDNSVSINLGFRDITNREMTEYIYEFLLNTEHPENFVFEILENEDIPSYDELTAFVDRIHKLGGKVSIDDFGSGFSNLQHVIGIPFDYLKIDGSIVKRCCENKQSEDLIALISVWKNLSASNVRIIAEYVENVQIHEKIMKYDIDFSQGYLFSRPRREIEI